MNSSTNIESFNVKKEYSTSYRHEEINCGRSIAIRGKINELIIIFFSLQEWRLQKQLIEQAIIRF